MTKAGLITVIALVLAGCGNNEIADAQSAVSYELIDPDSAKFRDVTSPEDGVVCGEVNGKNRLGGYTGFRPFYAVGGGEEWHIGIVYNSSSDLLSYYKRCDKKQAKIYAKAMAKREAEAEAYWDKIDAEMKAIEENGRREIVEIRKRQGESSPPDGAS